MKLQTNFKNWVNSEVEKKLDKDPFSSLPIRMRIGILLMLGSFVAGYGIPILLLVISKSKNQLATGLVKGSIVYVLCWISGAVGLSLAGKDCIKYPIYFFAKFLKKLFPNYFGKGNDPL